MNLFWARHMDTIYTLMKLQSLGVTETEILDIHARLDNSVRTSRGPIDSSLLYFNDRNDGLNFGAPK